MNTKRFFQMQASIILMFIVGCSNNYEIEGTYPAPLVEPIPIHVDVRFEDEFSNYMYEETQTGRSKISILLGAAQTELFTTVSNSMFSGDSDSPFLTITPANDRFQYSIPRETQANIYEVWIRYRVTVAETDDAPIADWLIVGYGKTPTATLKSRANAIQAATNIALRDVGSQLAIGFHRQPDIARWLKEELEENNDD